MKKTVRKFFKKQWRKWVVVLCLPLGVGVVSSCGCSKSSNPYINLSKSKSSNPDVNLSKIETPRSFFETINNYVHFQMPESAAILGAANIDENQPPLSPEQINKILNYLEKIQDKTLSIGFGTQTFSVSIDLTQYTKKIITSIKNDKRTNKEKRDIMTKREIATLDSKQPNIVAYLGYVSLGLGLAMEGFMSLPEVAWENYVNEMNYFHEIFWKIVSSQVYKNWIKGKMFSLPKGPVSKYNESTGQFFKKTMSEYKPGTYFDSKVPFILPSPNKPNEISNLGAEFGFLIDNIIP